MTDFKSEIAAKAEAALSEGDEGDGGDAGTATGKEEKVDPAKPKDDSAAADEGESSDELDEGEEDQDDAESKDDEESKEDSDEEKSEEDEESLDEDAEEDDEAEKPMTRSQKRIKQLIREKKLSQDENAVLKAQLAIKDGTPAEKAAADKKLLSDGYTPEQVAEGKKFLKQLGFASPEEVSAMKTKLDKIENDRLMEEDAGELRTALKKSKSELTEDAVMQQVKKWANSKDPRIAARASLDYGAIIRLISSKKVVTKVVDATIKAKKKAAPKIPAGGGGSVTKKDDAEDSRWNPGDRRGSMERLLEKAVAHLEEDE